MILIECPACDAPVATSLPLTESLHCDDCSVTWDIADGEPQQAKLAA